MPRQELPRQAELGSKEAHLVLEELPDRLDQLEAQLLRQPSDVVVRLDDLRRPLDRDGLDDVGIEGPLREVPRVGDPLRLPLEDLDEAPADDPALLLGVFDSGEAFEEKIRRVHGPDREAESPERLLDLRALVGAEQPVVHEDRVQPVADRLAQKERRDRGIHPARQRAHDRPRRGLPADRLDLLAAEGVHGPLGLRAADPEEKVLEDLGSVIRVADLGMEANRVNLPRGVLERADRAVRRGARDAEARRGRGDRVAVAHPDRLLGVEPGEEGRVGRELRDGPAVLAVPPSHDFPASGPGEPLHSVADAQDRHAEGRRIGRRRRRVLVVNALGPAREDDACRRVPRDLRGGSGGRENHREDPRFPHPAGDQLRVLRAEVQDDDRAGAHVRVLLRASRSGRASTAAGIAAAAAAGEGRERDEQRARRAPPAPPGPRPFPPRRPRSRSRPGKARRRSLRRPFRNSPSTAPALRAFRRGPAPPPRSPG